VTLDEFKLTLNDAVPPDDLMPLLEALWCDAQQDWDSAHRIAQSDQSKNGAWVHAYLHRKEGDLGNASYWYSQAGRKMPDNTPDQEWEFIAKSIIEQLK
jgi:hypothetical protein